MSTSNEIDEFWSTFNKSLNDIRTKLNDDIIINFSIVLFAEVKLQLMELQKLVTNSTAFLPLYDVKRAQEDIESCRKKIRKYELIVNPKKKFKFTCRSQNNTSNFSILSHSANNNSENATNDDTSIILLEENKKKLNGTYLIHNKVDETLILTSNDFHYDVNNNRIYNNNFQLYIDQCENCNISAQSVLGSARLENNKNCVIVLGPCSTSNYLENCVNCTIFLLCHQLRIHNCNNCSLHVLVNTHPIIEDCTQLKFYKNRCYYENMISDISSIGLAHASCWNNVIDFRWHKTVASPNWQAIENKEDIEKIILPSVFIDQGWFLIPLDSDANENLILRREDIKSKNNVSDLPNVAITTSKVLEEEDDDDDEI